MAESQCSISEEVLERSSPVIPEEQVVSQPSQPITSLPEISETTFDTR